MATIKIPQYFQWIGYTKMENKKIYLLIIVGIFLINLTVVVIAEAPTIAFVVPNSEIYNVKFSCENQGAMCSATATCNISINYANSSELINNGACTNLNNGYFNYTLSAAQTSANGEYSARASCIDGIANATSTFYYKVNPSGVRTSDASTESLTRSIYFLFGFSLLFFIAFFFVKSSKPVKWTLFILGFIFFLAGLNLLSVGLQDEVMNPRLETFFDHFTAISFIMYWFCGGVLIIMWILTFFQTVFYKKNLRRMQKYDSERGGGRVEF